MVKNIAILGSTGSVGVQTLECVRHLKKMGHKIKVTGLGAGKNIGLLVRQALEFNVDVVCVKDENLAEEFSLLAKKNNINPAIYWGDGGLLKVASLEGTHQVFNSLVGFTGLLPTLEAIKHKKDIALANKETLVAAGEIVMEAVRENNVKIIPVDSEHSAIYQCLMGNRRQDLKRVILTASGGPFRGKTREELAHVTVEMALDHPNWTMGKKITIDSATLMNKGLEIIEAGWLFGLKPGEVDVIVHPQSIIHSMVEYRDGSVMAQLGVADMRLPVMFALTHPQRVLNDFPPLDLLKTGKLTFEEPDRNSFICLDLAWRAFEAGGNLPCAMNGANEVCVELFLGKKISFTDIGKIIGRVMEKCNFVKKPEISDIIRTNKDARELAMAIYGGKG